jgi:hypothetical protein
MVIIEIANYYRILAEAGDANPVLKAASTYTTLQVQAEFISTLKTDKTLCSRK